MPLSTAAGGGAIGGVWEQRGWGPANEAGPSGTAGPVRSLAEEAMDYRRRSNVPITSKTADVGSGTGMIATSPHSTGGMPSGRSGPKSGPRT